MTFWNKLKSDCAQLLLTCREAARAQSEQLDHPLPRSTRIGLRLHLLICKWCRRYGRQIEFLRHVAHEHPEKFTEADVRKLSDDARRRIKQQLNQEKN
jgi:hypothetical protein